MANFGEIGKTGLLVWDGQVQADFLRQLRGKEAYKVYNEMRLNSPIVGALLAAIEQSVRGAQWNYVSDQGEGDARVELLNRARDNMSISWNDHISEALTMLPFGFALFEIVYERGEDGGILWRKFAPRGQDTVDRWVMDANGGLLGMVQRAAPDYKEVEIPIEKLLLYRTRVERGNPEGRSILRNAYTSYYYLTNIQQVEGIGIERDLAGIPVITLPEGANGDETDTTSEAYKAAKIVRNIRRDQAEGLVLPFGMTFELASTGGSRQFDTNAIVARYESRILMSTLTQFLMLGQDKVGTQALSQDQTEFFTKAANHIADILAEAHTKFAMPRLLALNGMEAEGIRLEHTPVGDVDTVQLMDALMKASDKITWTSQDEVWLRDVLRLPEMTPEDIEAEREKKKQEQQEMFQRQAQARGGAFGGPPHPAGKGEKEDQPTDREDNAYTVYAMDEDPSAPEEFNQWQRRAKRVWFSFLQGQQERAERAAKKTRGVLQ